MKGLVILAVLIVSRTAAGDDPPPCTPFNFTDQVAARTFWNADDRKQSATPVLMSAAEERPLGMFGTLLRRNANSFVIGVTQPAAMPVDPPFDAVGKLFLATRLGTRGDFCTASFVEPDILITAAHCVCPSFCFDRILFTRVFGSGGDEDFDINAWTVPDEWFQLSDPDRFLFDYAFLSTAAPLSAVAPIRIDPAVAPTCIAAGYPLTINLGAAMDTCEGSAALDQSLGMIVMENNDLGEGSSGGPWVPSINHVAGNSLFTVASRFGPTETSLLGAELDPIRIGPLIARARRQCRPAG